MTPPQIHPPGLIRVAHVLDSLGRGGLETGVLNLLERLDSNRFQQGVFCLREAGSRARRAEATGALVRIMPRSPGRDRCMALKLRPALRRFRPHIVHTRNFGSLDGVIAARLARVPAVIHGEHGWEQQDAQGQSLRRRRIRRWISPWVNQFVAVSADLGAWLASQGRLIASRLTVIPNGVDEQVFRPRDPSKHGDFTIGTLGRLDPIKNQAALLEAFESVASDFPRTRLVLAGDGELGDELRTRAAASPFKDRIQLPGVVTDPSAFYAALDLFVLPSWNEGQSNTLLEAMACALPVVATRVGGTPEIVADGETGLLVPPGSREDLAQALRRVLGNPEEGLHLGRAGRARIEAEFRLERMVADYAKLYARAVTKGA